MAAFLLSACSDHHDSVHYDGGALLKEKCAACHNLSMPPKTFQDEKAPPMMAVAFHVKDFMKVATASDKKPKFIEFFQEYVLHPSAEKSFCDKESLASYGVMPSQEGKVSKEEVGAIAEYVYTYYDEEKFLAQMQAKAKFDVLPLGEQIMTKNGCKNCHSIDKPKAGPSFRMIAKRSDTEIKQVILHGSKGKWKGFEKAMMPPFKQLNDQDIDVLVKWIKSL